MWFLKRQRDHISPETLSEFLDGRLSATEHAKWERHIEYCGGCKEEFDSLRYTVGLLRRVPMENPRRTFTLAVAPEVTPVRMGLRAPAWAYGAATSVAVLVFAVVLSADLTGLLSEDVSGPTGPDQALEAPIAPTESSVVAEKSVQVEETAPFQATPQPTLVQREIALEVIKEVKKEVVAEAEVAESAAQAIPAPEIAAIAVQAPAPVEAATPSAAPAVEPITPDTEVSQQVTDTTRLADTPLPTPHPEESAQLQVPTPAAPTGEPLEATSPEEAPGATSLLWHVLEGVSGAAALFLLGWGLWRVRFFRKRAAS